MASKLVGVQPLYKSPSSMMIDLHRCHEAQTQAGPQSSIENTTLFMLFNVTSNSECAML